MPRQLHVFIEGRVQGVGFRFATARQAGAAGLSGWVCNLPDGRVEACFEGDQAALDGMLAWCSAGPIHSNIRHVEIAWSDAPQGYESFEIRY